MYDAPGGSWRSSSHPSARPMVHRNAKSPRTARSVGEEDRANVIDRSGGSTVIEWNRPDVVQRHVPEKRVAAQVELLELCRIGAHACHRLSRAAPLSLILLLLEPSAD